MFIVYFGANLGTKVIFWYGWIDQDSEMVLSCSTVYLEALLQKLCHVDHFHVNSAYFNTCQNEFWTKVVVLKY